MKYSLASLLLASCAAVGLPAPASAQSVSAQISCQRSSRGRTIECPGAGTYSNTEGFSVSASESTNSDISPGNGVWNSFLSAQAFLDYGRIGVSVTERFQNVAEDSISHAVGVNSASVQVEGQWQDLIWVGGAGLGNGETVTVKATQIIDLHEMSATVIDAYGSAAVLYSRFSAPGLRREGCAQVYINAQIDFCGHSTTESTLHVGRNIFEYNFTMPVSQGGQLIGGTLWAFGFTRQISSLGGGSVNVDALHTANTYLTVLTPGASLVSASGHDYALPALGGVPEPASWALMLAGFGMIGFTLRTRSKPIVAQ